MRAIKNASVFALVFLGMFVTSAHAQEITVKVPFHFAIGSQEFPAGNYDIRPAVDSPVVVSIRGTDNRSARFAFTIPADGGDPAGDQPALLFKRVENEYRLSQIWEARGEGFTLSGASAAPGTTGEEARDVLPEDSYLVRASWK